MRTHGWCARVLAWSGAALLTVVAGVWAEEGPRPLFSTKPAVGIVTDVVGPVVRMPASDPIGTAPLRGGDVISIGDEIRIGKDGKLELLWDHRAVVELHDEARATIGEAQYGQTVVQLHRGSVRIALSYNAGRVTDTLTLRTPLAHLTTRGGIVEAMVPSAERRSMFAELLSGSSGETVRMVEGTARIEPLTGEAKSVALKTGNEVLLKAGNALAVSEREPSQASTQPLVIREEHRQLPSPIMRQIVNAQVGAALETAQGFMVAAGGAEKEPAGLAPKGVILATSAGMPATSLLSSPATTGSVSPASVPQVSPPVQPSSVGNLGPAQSGGLNSRNILTRLLKDLGKRTRGSGNK